MNNQTVLDCARGFAKTLLDGHDRSPAGQTQLAYQLALCRPPDDEEAALAAEFVAAQTTRYAAQGAKDASWDAWADFCQLLLSLNEFAYVD
jgi:hypothetical protein